MDISLRSDEGRQSVGFVLQIEEGAFHLTAPLKRSRNDTQYKKDKMRQRAQPSPSKKDRIQRPSNSLQNPLASHQRRHQQSGEPSRSWEISDHVALTIEEADHESIDLECVGIEPYQRQSAPRSCPQHQLLKPHQYLPAGGSTLMTEEKLRRFTEQTNQSKQQLSLSSPTSSVALTAWKLDQYRLEDFHTVFRTPHHVPDSQYEAFILGQSARRKDASLMTKTCCAQTCAGFSAIAVGFLVFVGIVLDKQPLYIPGTLPELVVQSTVAYTKDGSTRTYSKPVIQFLVPGPNDERLPAASVAYKAAAAYFLCMLISLYVLDPAPFHNAARVITQKFSKQYEDIPETIDNGSSTLPTFHQFSRSSSGELSERAASYQPGWWNRTTGRIQQWLAIRGWYRARKFRKYAQKKKG